MHMKTKLILIWKKKHIQIFWLSIFYFCSIKSHFEKFPYYLFSVTSIWPHFSGCFSKVSFKDRKLNFSEPRLSKTLVLVRFHGDRNFILFLPYHLPVFFKGKSRILRGLPLYFISYSVQKNLFSWYQIICKIYFSIII